MSLIKNLFLKYDDFEINIPKMELLDRGVTALCGPSGSGKTTVLRALLGLEECKTLSWDFAGVNLATMLPGDRRIGVVFQNYELFPHMTGLQNIQFAARARRLVAVEANKKIDELVDILKAGSFINKQTAVLSGGEKQRVALMRAIIGEPRILFLDEPFSSLDTNLRAEARDLVKKVIQKSNSPVLLISHDQEDIKDLADRILRISNGRLA